MISLDYAFYHIERAIRMMRGDANALDEMDISTDGFWRSFGAILFTLPALFFTWVAAGRDLILEGSDLQMWQIMLRKAPVDIASWVLPILIYPFVLNLLGRKNRYSHLVIALNWSGLVLNYAIAGLIFIGFLLPKTGSLSMVLALVTFAMLIVLIGMLVQVVKISLSSSIWLAAIFVVAEIVIFYPLIYGAEDLLGLHVAALT